METVTVNLGPRSYQILVGAGLLGELGSLLHHYRFTTPRLALVTDSIVSKIYREKVVGILEHAGFTPWVVEIPAGEECVIEIPKSAFANIEAQVYRT